MAKKAQAIPKGYHSVTPSIVVAGAAKAIDFYKKALGAEELMRFPGPDGSIMHAEIRIGDSPIMLGDEMPEHGGRGPNSYRRHAGRLLHLRGQRRCGVEAGD